MKQTNPLPLLMLCGFLGGLGLAVLTALSGYGWLLALAAYSFGGAAIMLLSGLLVAYWPDQPQKERNAYHQQDQLA